MIDGLIAGRLYGQAAERIDKAGKTFTVARVRASSNDGENLFVNVIAFDVASRAALGALADGDGVCLAGTLTPRVWTDKQGNTRPSLDMVAHQVMSAYHVHRKRRAMEGDLPATDHPHGEDFPPEPLGF